MTDRSISPPGSPFRRRMIEDMTVRGFTASTQQGYIPAVRDFTVYFGRSPDTASAEDLRRYQLHMRSEGATATTMNAAVTAPLFRGLVPPHQVNLRLIQFSERKQIGVRNDLR